MDSAAALMPLTGFHGLGLAILLEQHVDQGVREEANLWSVQGLRASRRILTTFLAPGRHLRQGLTQ
jgi:hypothetical protein